MMASNRMDRLLGLFRIWVRLDMIAGIVIAVTLLAYLTLRSS
ncbi:hypothetical protein [Bradyrhizobium sp.]|nr:hypothetical protein [Bradyrhizobium sp.]